VVEPPASDGDGRATAYILMTSFGRQTVLVTSTRAPSAVWRNVLRANRGLVVVVDDVDESFYPNHTRAVTGRWVPRAHRSVWTELNYSWKRAINVNLPKTKAQWRLHAIANVTLGANG
jgi:hypothetical protein